MATGARVRPIGLRIPGVLGQRRVDEIQDIHVHVDDQRPGGQPSQRVGSRLAGAAAQFFRTDNEQRSLLHLSALPLGGESEIDAQERHPVRVEKGSMPQSTTHRVDRPGQFEPVSHAHPVERPVGGAFGGVAVQMAVYVKQGRRAFRRVPHRRHTGQRAGAVAPEHEHVTAVT